MGIVPAARGLRWGVAATRFAQFVAHRSGREQLVLAVDAANAPAVRMYRECGFVSWAARRVFVKSLDQTMPQL
jgi:ribosomal protein S18 acetylase RimI-like enzyme